MGWTQQISTSIYGLSSLIPFRYSLCQGRRFRTIVAGTAEISRSSDQISTSDPPISYWFYVELFQVISVITECFGHFGRNIDFRPKSFKNRY